MKLKHIMYFIMMILLVVGIVGCGKKESAPKTVETFSVAESTEDSFKETEEMQGESVLEEGLEPEVAGLDDAEDSPEIIQDTENTEETATAERGEPETEEIAEEQEMVMKLKVVKPDVRVRSSASTEEENVIQLAQEGDVFELLAEDNGWFQIRMNNGSIAYISSLYNLAETITETAPVLEERPEVETAENTTEIDAVEESTEETTEVADASQQQKVIVIDPGHQQNGDSSKEPVAPGSSELKAKVSSGTRGTYTKIPEYDLNLDVSLKLKAELEARGYTVIMTRTVNDVNISNSERAQVANDNHADAFIRIHANGSENAAVNGMMTICQTASNPYCGNMYERSKILSTCILDAMVANTGANRERVWETDTMSGINWCQVPVTIVEMGYMTNQEEDEKLKTDEYRTQIAVGIANGLKDYFNLICQ